MISICIPVYNADVRQLVANLHQMGKDARIDFEIVLIDDASTDLQKQKQNEEVEKLEGVSYKVLSNNVGRNLIKFELANSASYDHLLFLDADSGFPDSLFITRYLQADWKNKLVIGGRIYQPDKPSVDHLLHWKYGTAREQRSAELRVVDPYRSFMACNFLISKKILQGLIIDRDLTGYCHEDTFMGMQFEKQRIPVIHINNPVIHLGLDTSVAFLEKQRQALHHLHYIYRTYNNQLPVVRQVRLLQAFEKLSRRGGMSLYSKAFTLVKRKVLKNLASTRPSLFLLDLYKLGIFAEMSRRKTT